jgi:hypothetical protein
MVEYIVEMDAQSSHHRKYYDKLFAPAGLGMESLPTKTFHTLSHQRLGMGIFRFIVTVHMMRIYWSNIAEKHLRTILSRPSMTEATKKAWIDVQQTFERIARSEADLLLGMLPFYIPPGQSQLSPSAVSSLIWPLSTLRASQQLTKEQKAHAKLALLQIGERSNIAIATKLAERRTLDSELPEEVHLIHLTWQN